MNYFNLAINLGLLAGAIFFSYTIIRINWAGPLINTHYVSGMYCTILYPIKKILPESVWVNILTGSLFIGGIVTSVCGLVYVGVKAMPEFMAVSFAIYGYILFAISFTGFITTISLFYFEHLKSMYAHIINIFGVLVFSSLFYRILYLYAKISGYDIPTNSTPVNHFKFAFI